MDGGARERIGTAIAGLCRFYHVRPGDVGALTPAELFVLTDALPILVRREQALAAGSVALALAGAIGGREASESFREEVRAAFSEDGGLDGIDMAEAVDWLAVKQEAARRREHQEIADQVIARRRGEAN